MTASQATAGMGTLIKRGDGGVGAGVKASRTMGSTNSQIIITAKTAGTPGNAITFAMVASGNNTPLSVAKVANAITVTLETDGSAASASTVNDVIAALYANPAIAAVIDATDGVGDGTGIVLAASSAALSGGSYGAEVFTAIAEVKDISGPNRSNEFIDVTHMQSDGKYREFLPSLKTGGEVSFPVNFLPDDASHAGLQSDRENQVRRNFQIVYPNGASTTYQFAAFVQDFNISAPMADVLSGSITLKITGAISTL